ncbi:hypothetical protein Rhe02_04740 [Rhizocola hellebori]|uniref:CN hydrolase domain-containing protein n=1 Tax=Rhizocola hellebori TaxID=1392758 RepID=A0A8J3Q2Z6_9ACTN|nr:nitrilase-related carbon-nitrogen hydrolase [Rhizocola hellebori]GIH02407.1 hypothetical protein Rhe02_04740 [Rhizocola hellebori]
MGLVRVAAVQLEATQDVSENLATCLRLIDDAAARGAQLIVLPEFCNHLSWYADRAQARERATRPGDPFLTSLSERAARHGVHLKVNVTHAHPDGTTGGTNFLFGPSGELLGQCDKQTLMGSENDFLNPGGQVGPIVDTPLGRLGMYACMEGVLPEVARGLALRGAQVLLNSLNSFATDEASLHIPVRAAENRVWVVAANKIGPLLPIEHLPRISAGLGVPPQWLHGAGESQIVAPDGTVVARGPRTGEAVVIADIDPALADAKGRAFTARRPALYGPLAQPPHGRRHPAGAPSLNVAVVRSPDAVATAAADGAELILLTVPADPSAVATALANTTAHAVLAQATGGVLVGAQGVVGRQEQGEAPCVFAMPWGRLAIVIGEDSIVPEHFRLAALDDADVVVVLGEPQEPWELALGLPERAAENRLNLVHSQAVFSLSGDFTLWTQWEGPFTGRISHPIITEAKPGEEVTHAVVAPAQAANRLVSRNTDLVDGRPWRLLHALIEG